MEPPKSRRIYRDHPLDTSKERPNKANSGRQANASRSIIHCRSYHWCVFVQGNLANEVTPVEVELVISTRNGLNEINFVSNEALKIKARARRWSRRRWFYIERSGWKGPNDRSSAACMFAHIIESDNTIVYAVRCVYDVHYVRRRTRTMQTFVVKKKSKFKWIKSPPNHYALLGAASPTGELLILSYLLSPPPPPKELIRFYPSSCPAPSIIYTSGVQTLAPISVHFLTLVRALLLFFRLRLLVTPFHIASPLHPTFLFRLSQPCSDLVAQRDGCICF